MSQTMKWVVADVVADMIVCAGYKEIGGDETRSIVMKAATDFLCTDSSSTDTSMLLCRWATEIVAALARMPFGLLPKLNAPRKTCLAIREQLDLHLTVLTVDAIVQSPH